MAVCWHGDATTMLNLALSAWQKTPVQRVKPQLRCYQNGKSQTWQGRFSVQHF